MFKFILKKDKKIEEVNEHNAKLVSLIHSKNIQIDSLKQEIAELKEQKRQYIDICKDLDEEQIPNGYLPTDQNEYEMFIAELSRLYENKYLQKVIDYTINLVANYSLRQDKGYDVPRAKYVIEGIDSILEQLKSANKKWIELNEAKRPLTQEDQEELIRTSIDEVINQ